LSIIQATFCRRAKPFISRFAVNECSLVSRNTERYLIIISTFASLYGTGREGTGESTPQGGPRAYVGRFDECVNAAHAAQNAREPGRVHVGVVAEHDEPHPPQRLASNPAANARECAARAVALTHWCTCMYSDENTCEGLARGDRTWPLNDGQIPKLRGVRVHVSTRSIPGEGNRRASRNGCVSSPPARNPYRYDSQFVSVHRANRL
jgi:hypothetical protein